MVLAGAVGDLVRPENEGEVGWPALAFHISSLARPLILIRVWGVGWASFNHPGTIPALNYRPQIYGLINVNNLVLSRFTAPKLHQSNRKVVRKLILIQKGSMYHWPLFTPNPPPLLDGVE